MNTATDKPAEKPASKKTAAAAKAPVAIASAPTPEHPDPVANETIEMVATITKAEGGWPSTGTRFKALKDGTFSITSGETDRVESAETFTENMVDLLQRNGFADLEIDEAVIEVFDANDQDDGPRFRIKAEDVASFRLALLCAGAHNIDLSLNTAALDSIDLVRANLNSVFESLAGIQLVSGGIQAYYAETEEEKERTLRYMFRDGECRIQRIIGGRKPEVKESVTLFQMVQALREHKTAGAEITILPSVEAMFEFSFEKYEVLVISVDGEMQAIDSPAELVKLVKQRLRAAYDETLHDGVASLTEMHSALNEMIGNVKGSLSGWIKDLDVLLPDLSILATVEEPVADAEAPEAAADAAPAAPAE